MASTSAAQRESDEAVVESQHTRNQHAELSDAATDNVGSAVPTVLHAYFCALYLQHILSASWIRKTSILNPDNRTLQQETVHLIQ